MKYPVPLIIRLLGLTLAIILSQGKSPVLADEPYRGIFSFTLENDIFSGNDNNYTNGAAVSWATPDVQSLGKKNVFSKLVRGLSFLPTIGNAKYRNYVGLAIGQEMYTPRDISLVDPPLGDQPYAGVIFLDTIFMSKTTVSMHEFGLRLGMVGSSSYAEETQTFVHKAKGVQEPNGWDTQLRNEPLLNFAYHYNHRLLSLGQQARYLFDFTGSGGANLGNYLTGADITALFRVGYKMPDTYGNISIRGGAAPLAGMDSLPGGFHTNIFFQINGNAIAHFLPTDGNSFEDSREGDRDDFNLNYTTGFMLGYRRLVLTYAYTAVFNKSRLPGTNEHDYGAAVVSLIF